MLRRGSAENRTCVVHENVDLMFLLHLLDEGIDRRAVGKIAFRGTGADDLCSGFFKRIGHSLADTAVGTCDECRLSGKIVCNHNGLEL